MEKEGRQSQSMPNRVWILAAGSEYGVKSECESKTEAQEGSQAQQWDITQQSERNRRGKHHTQRTETRTWARHSTTGSASQT